MSPGPSSKPTRRRSGRDAARSRRSSPRPGLVLDVDRSTPPVLMHHGEQFRLEKLPADRKSVAYTFLYRAADRTLKSEEVDAAHERVLAHLGKALPISFRG